MTPSPRHLGPATHRAHPHLSPGSGLAMYGAAGDGVRGGAALGGGQLGASLGLDAVALSHKLMQDVHPALQTVQSQYPTPKTRMRTSFDPELELPKLQRWFAENQHPSRQQVSSCLTHTTCPVCLTHKLTLECPPLSPSQIQQYVRELNSLESRRGRKPLDVNNVVYWFKNARAAQKRAEIRSGAPGE